MRHITTFILRLYTDPAAAARVCGDLRALPARTAHPFRDEGELLALVDRLTHEGIEAGESAGATQAAAAPSPRRRR